MKPETLARATAGVAGALAFHGAQASLLEWSGRRPRASREKIDRATRALAIGEARLKARQFERAIPFFREAIASDRAATLARGGLAHALFALGRKKEAARELEALGELDPGAEVQALLAEVRRQAGDTVGSIEAFRRAAVRPRAEGSFLLGERLLGEDAWRRILSTLETLRATRPAVGVGAHLIRGRDSSVARALTRAGTARRVADASGGARSEPSATDRGAIENPAVGRALENSVRLVPNDRFGDTLVERAF
jgi:tetratricopeptide (TPR) repeat protein